MNPIEAAILSLVEDRGPQKSICPTEAARLLCPGPGEAWRGQLKAVRAAALRLASEGRLVILRKGRPVEPSAELRGVIRLRAAAAPLQDDG